MGIVDWFERKDATFKRTRFICQTTAFALSFVVVLVSWKWHLGRFPIAVWVFSLFLAEILYIAILKDSLMGKFLLCAMIMGFVELFADHWLVEDIKVLTYPADGPHIWSSPLYMPFLWGTMTLLNAHIAWIFTLRIGLVKTTAMFMLMGLAMGLKWESMARGAEWWWYSEAGPMISDVPWFIIIGEVFCMMTLPFMLFHLGNRSFVYAVPFGVALGLFIWLGYYLAYSIVT